MLSRVADDTISQEELEDQLSKVAAQIEESERRLSVQRSRRDDLMQRAIRSGSTERAAAEAAGVSASYAHLASKYGRYARAARW